MSDIFRSYVRKDEILMTQKCSQLFKLFLKAQNTSTRTYINIFMRQENNYEGKL